MDHMTDSNTFDKHLLLRCMTTHSAHFRLIDVLIFFRNVLTGIHQKFARRTIESVWWSRPDATSNEMKGVSKGKFEEVVKPS